MNGRRADRIICRSLGRSISYNDVPNGVNCFEWSSDPTRIEFLWESLVLYFFPALSKWFCLDGNRIVDLFEGQKDGRTESTAPVEVQETQSRDKLPRRVGVGRDGVNRERPAWSE